MESENCWAYGLYHPAYRIAENFGGRKLWQIDYQQKLANTILANVLDYIAHIIQNDSTVEKEHDSNSEASLNSVLKKVFSCQNFPLCGFLVTILCVLVSFPWPGHI